MNLKKNNKGYVGVDISIAVIILLILIPTIMGIVYSNNSTIALADTKAGAINIAVNAIEAAKGIANLENVTPQNIYNELSEGTYNGKMGLNSDNEEVIQTDKASYKLTVTVTDYSEIDTNATANMVKTVKAVVQYKIKGKELQSIELSTVLR